MRLLSGCQLPGRACWGGEVLCFAAVGRTVSALLGIRLEEETLRRTERAAAGAQGRAGGQPEKGLAVPPGALPSLPVGRRVLLYAVTWILLLTAFCTLRQRRWLRGWGPSPYPATPRS